MPAKKYTVGVDICSVEGCNLSASARGMCANHYDKFWYAKIRTGQAEKLTPGPPAMEDGTQKRRVQLYVNPDYAAFLEAEDIEEDERLPIARRRKREAAEMLAQAHVASRII